MVKRVVMMVGILVLVAASDRTWAAGPGTPQVWTAETRKSNPVGYLAHMEGQLKQRLAAMATVQRTLAVQVYALGEAIREQEIFRDHALDLAGELRDRYQDARNEGRFPVEVRRVAYTESQTQVKVQGLLTEGQSYEASLALLKRGCAEAENHIESMKLKIRAGQNLLVAMAAERDLIAARLTSEDGETVLAQAEGFLTGAEQVIKASPVRQVRDLIKAGMSGPSRRVTAEEAKAFLEARPQSDNSSDSASGNTTGSKTGSMTLGRAHVLLKVEPEIKRTTSKPRKPIFQQQD